MPRGIPRNSSINQKILHRLSIAQGQLTKVISMVKDNEYCVDVINQSLAVQSALKQANQIILKNHLETCALDAANKGKLDSVIKEVITVMDKHDCCSQKCDCQDCKCQCQKCDCGCQECGCKNEKEE
jgi:DNA-binding FrmR family transcriptional regulator